MSGARHEGAADRDRASLGLLAAAFVVIFLLSARYLAALGAGLVAVACVAVIVWAVRGHARR